MRNQPEGAGIIRLYNTGEHPCSYLQGQSALTQFVDPQLKADIHLASALVQRGFRRSGNHFYRPRCPRCDACQSLRVISREFRPSRTQRRCWRNNSDLDTGISPAAAADHDRYYRLYAQYINARHYQGDMYPASRKQYDDFVATGLTETRFLEFYLHQELVMVAQTDQLEDGLSAVYTFYRPDLAARSLGTYAILHQIELCRSLGEPYLYLGYWIRDCHRMNYKSGFRPHEIHRDGHWQRL